jgi:hypothetical protein
VAIPVLTKFFGVNVAASIAAAQPTAKPSKAVARDQNPPIRPAAPAGQMSSLSIPAAKMELHLYDDADLQNKEEGRFTTWMDAQFNPDKLSETISAVWSDIVVPGLSHERRHYSHTKSVPFKFTLQFDALEYMQNANVDQFENPGITAGVDYVDSAMNFLRSLGYASTTTGSPPRVLFYWPNFISLTATVEEIGIEYTGWARTGEVLRFSAAISLKEIRDAHMTRTDVLVSGNQRSSRQGIG